MSANLGRHATLIILGEVVDLVQVQAEMSASVRYQHWIAIKRSSSKIVNNRFLPNQHFRLIMPAHYTILCFSKGVPRELPGLIGEAGSTDIISAPKAFEALRSLADGYCLRSNCIEIRQKARINDRTNITDLWVDIHRLKHNSRRVDHPCQLPPHLMYRIISVFTKPGEVVLDCFNGAGTTTLAASQVGRKYVGIETSDKYCLMAKTRHM